MKLAASHRQVLSFQISFKDDNHRHLQTTRNVMTEQKNNPLHGVTLQQILTQLVDHYGWQELGALINIRCFQTDPSIKSSLAFLRKTSWAREKVEQLYIKTNFQNNI